MSHSSSQTAVSSADCGSRDLNAHFTLAHTETSIYQQLEKKKKKNQTVLFWDLIAGSNPERVLLTTNRSGRTDREKKAHAYINDYNSIRLTDKLVFLIVNKIK